MHDIARKAKRISGHTLEELEEMLYTMAREHTSEKRSQDNCCSRAFQCGLHCGTSDHAF